MFALDQAARHRLFLDAQQRLAGCAIQNEYLAALGTLDQRLHHAVPQIRICKRGLGIRVVVPQVVVGGLKGPTDIAAADVQCNHRARIALGFRCSVAPPEIRRRVAGRNIHQAELFIRRHGCPGIRRTRDIFLALGQRFAQTVGTVIPRPYELSGSSIEGTDHQYGIARHIIVREPAATQDDSIVDDHRR